MLKQYRAIKARYPDALVLYRLGDFYELFEKDAELVARQLGLTLTTRRFSKHVHLPMCGIPHHRLNTYTARLIARGHKLAIAEQLENAPKTRRLIKRDVVRVITPGTVIEDALLDQDRQNLLVGIARRHRRGKACAEFGLATMDLSTGEFATTQIDSPDAEQIFWEEFGRLDPSEVVLPQRLSEDESFVDKLRSFHPGRISPIEDEAFSPTVAGECLRAHLGVASLEGFGCDELPLAIAAAGGVLHYLCSNQISQLSHIVGLTTYDLASYVSLDAVSQQNLELLQTLRTGRKEGSLYNVIDCTQTAMGRRLLSRWIVQPLADLASLNRRQDAVAELFEHPLLRSDIRTCLDQVYDVERLVGRIGFGNANARDLVMLRSVLERVPQICDLLAGFESPFLHDIDTALHKDALSRVARAIADAIVNDPPILLREGGLIQSGYDTELDRLRGVASTGREWLADLETRERKRTGIKNLRIRYNQVFGFFIEITKSNLDRVPENYERRATVRHAERFVTPELKAREAEILTAETKINEREYDLFAQIRSSIADQSSSLIHAARALAQLDVLASLAEVAATKGYTRPTLGTGSRIEVCAGRHPVVEKSLPDGERFVPNDVHLDQDERLLIITGPNMSGKSVYIRQVALIALLAQIGSFVPANEAHIDLIDRIFVRAGASDDITRARSTFLVEMSETGYILRHATQQSLVILDEVGRGTSTYDGMSIAWAVAEAIHNDIGARTLFATHFHELTRLTEHLDRAQNYTLAVTEREQKVVFLRQLVPGGADKSYGIQVARLAGLPEHVIERAQQILAQFERSDSVKKVDPTSLQPETMWAVRDRSPVLHGIDESQIWALVCDLYQLDIANMTPMQALIALNDLQSQLHKDMPL
jgi:DNA mismatch repair protein MutS